MEKNLKDYLHLYMGCDVFVFTPESVHDGFLDKYIKDYPNGEYKIPVAINNIQQVLSNGYLPLLRPLSSMTHDEKHELRIFIGSQNSFDFYFFSDIEQASKIFHYLLSKNFDLFGLIESGLAIDATTITTKTA